MEKRNDEKDEEHGKGREIAWSAALSAGFQSPFVCSIYGPLCPESMHMPGYCCHKALALGWVGCVLTRTFPKSTNLIIFEVWVNYVPVVPSCSFCCVKDALSAT